MYMLQRRIWVLITCLSLCAPSVWAQNAAFNGYLENTLQQKATQQREKQLNQELQQAFDYDEIINSLYRLYDFYSEAHEGAIHQNQRLAYEEDLRKRGIVVLNPDSTYKPRPLAPLKQKNSVLEKISKNKFTQPELLEAIAPIDPVKDFNDSWETTLYAAMYVPNMLGTLQGKTKANEKFLRHLQMRILFRISQIGELEVNDSILKTEALAQLRIALISCSVAYKRLYNADPLASFKPSYPYAHYLDEVVVVAKGKAQTKPSHEKREQYPNSDSVYAWQRDNFLGEISYWKSTLPTDTYTFTKTIEALKSRNKTTNFSFAKASGDIASDFLFITAAKSLFSLAFSKQDKAAPSQLRIMAPAAVEYALLSKDVSQVARIIAILEPEKLGENRYGGVFKNDALYQATQPAIAEIFNTLYIYAITPGRTPQEWTQVMKLLADFANPRQYSIMTRLSAIAVAAKLLDMRNEALNPYRPNENTEAAKKQALPSQTPTAQQSYQDYMARNIVDIYATLTATSILAGLQDYGMNAKQMKTVADQLARLYNIFATGTSAQYPAILPPSRDNVEEVWGYNERGLREKQLHHFGARAKTSWGEEIELNLSAPLNREAKLRKDGGEFIGQLAADILSWRLLVSVVRIGGAGVRATMRFIMPAGTQLVPVATLAQGANAMARMPLNQALKEGADLSAKEMQHLQYVLAHPIPEVKTTEEALRFLGLPSTASKSEIKTELGRLTNQYHTDKFGSFLTDSGKKFINEQISHINNMRGMLLRSKTSTAVPVMGNTTENAAKAAQQAASVTRKQDPHSLVNIARGFASFYAFDYLLSYANVPLQESMIEAETELAQKQNQPDMYDDKQVAQGNPKDAPLYMLDEVASQASPQRLGSSILLPINLIRKAADAQLLTPQDMETFQSGARMMSYQHAFNAGTAAQLQKQLEGAIKDLEEGQTAFLKNNEDFLAALPTGKKEMKTAYQTYRQALKQAVQLTQTNWPQAQKDSDAAAIKFINSQADIMTRAIQASTKQQLKSAIEDNLLFYQQQFGDVLTQSDCERIKRIVTNYLRTQEKHIITFYTANQQTLGTDQDPMVIQQQANRAMQQLNERLQEQWATLQQELAARQQSTPWAIEQRAINKQFTLDLQQNYPLELVKYPEIEKRFDALFNSFALQIIQLQQTNSDLEHFRGEYEKAHNKFLHDIQALKKQAIEEGYGFLWGEQSMTRPPISPSVIPQEAY